MLICPKAAQPHSTLFHLEHFPSISVPWITLGCELARVLRLPLCMHSACQIGINITLVSHFSKYSFEIVFKYPLPCCLRAGVPRDAGGAVWRRGSCGEGAAAGAPALDRARPLSNAPPRAFCQNHSRGVLADLSTPARCWITASNQKVLRCGIASSIGDVCTL
jgi:hypothetical protein